MNSVSADVLILTNKEDITADFVVLELQHRGIPYFRFNSEDFPQRIKGTIKIGYDAFEYILDTPKGYVCLNNVSAFWYRRPGKPEISRDIHDKGVIEFCQNESTDFLEGIWLFKDKLWISYPPAIFQAQNKIYQLSVAKKMGFQIPETLISNNNVEVNQFANNTTIVVKSVRQGALTINNKEHVIFTNKIENEDAKYFEGVHYSPCIFQHLIEKQFDLRITVIGEKVFPVEIHTDDDSIIDWRSGDQNKLIYKVHKLPDYLIDICTKFVKELGLKFGAIDLIYSKSGTYYFLEINPNGQWAWIEQSTNIPLSKNIVDLLTKYSTNK